MMVSMLLAVFSAQMKVCTHSSVSGSWKVFHHPKISSQDQLCGQKLTINEGLEDGTYTVQFLTVHYQSITGREGLSNKRKPFSPSYTLIVRCGRSKNCNLS